MKFPTESLLESTEELIGMRCICHVIKQMPIKEVSESRILLPLPAIYEKLLYGIRVDYSRESINIIKDQ